MFFAFVVFVVFCMCVLVPFFVAGCVGFGLSARASGCDEPCARSALPIDHTIVLVLCRRGRKGAVQYTRKHAIPGRNFQADFSRTSGAHKAKMASYGMIWHSDVVRWSGRWHGITSIT